MSYSDDIHERDLDFAQEDKPVKRTRVSKRTQSLVEAELARNNDQGMDLNDSNADRSRPEDMTNQGTDNLSDIGFGSTEIELFDEQAVYEDNPSLVAYTSAFPPDPQEIDFKDHSEEDLTEEEVARHDAHAEILSNMYGLDTESLSTSEVLDIIHQVGSGPARDQALNSEISLEELDRLAKEEKVRLQERQRKQQEEQVHVQSGPSIVITDSDDALAVGLLNANSKVLDSVNAINAANAVNSAMHSERGKVAFSETTDLGKSLANRTLINPANMTVPSTLLDSGNLPASGDMSAYTDISSLAKLGVADAVYLGNQVSGAMPVGFSSPFDEHVPHGLDLPQGYPVSIEKLKALVDIGMTLDMLQQYLEEHKIWVLQTEELKQLLAVTLEDLKDFLTKRLDPCYPIIYIDVLDIKMLTKLNLVVEHPFYVVMGFNLDGDRKLLSTGAMPREYKSKESQVKLWRSVLMDLRQRGLIDPIYMVTANVDNFKNVLREVYPKGIVQISLEEIARRASLNMETLERIRFATDYKSLYNSKSLLECMKALDRLADPWKNLYPESIQTIRDNFVYFEQYFAAQLPLRVCIRSTKPIDIVAKDLRRDLREDHDFRYQDALHVMCRIIETETLVSRKAKPVQWKRAIKAMYDDMYTGTILGKYVDSDKLKVPRRATKKADSN